MSRSDYSKSDSALSANLSESDQLDNMSRYSGGTDRPFWIEAYGGRAYPVDRRSEAEPVRIDHFAVGLIGGIQPARLDVLLRRASEDDGLLARCLLVWPDTTPPMRPRTAADPARLRRAMERLLALEPLAGDEDIEEAQLVD